MFLSTILCVLLDYAHLCCGISDNRQKDASENRGHWCDGSMSQVLWSCSSVMDFMDITVAIGINPVKSSHRTVHGTATGTLWALQFESMLVDFPHAVAAGFLGSQDLLKKLWLFACIFFLCKPVSGMTSVQQLFVFTFPVLLNFMFAVFYIVLLVIWIQAT